MSNESAALNNGNEWARDNATGDELEQSKMIEM